ncbi:MAG: ABC transporter substrate-binding protein, partial [Candidatus Binatia bacterium]
MIRVDRSPAFPLRASTLVPRLSRLVAAVVLAAFATSCTPVEVPPFRVGVPLWVPGEFAFVAGELGYFNDQEVELVHYGSPIELARHFREGSLDAAALTLDFAPYLAESMPSVDVVFVIDVSHGADAIISVAAVRTLENLRGLRVGVESGPLGAHMLLRGLKAGGLERGDVEIVSVDTEDQFDAFLADKVDAVVTYEPDVTRLVRAGGVTLFDSSRIPGRIVDVLITPTATAEQMAPILRKLIAGWLGAFARLQADRAVIVPRLASALSTDSGVVETALAGVRLGDLAINRELLGGR